MKPRHFLSGLLMVLLAASLNLACEKDNDNDDDSDDVFATVTMKNSVFTSANLQVTTGSKVVWKNDDNVTHTVTADNNTFNSGDIQPGGSFSHTFNSTGTFTYYCAHHAGMTGAIIVVAQ